uniref:Uncharacterized protein n=1 Tax=Bombyx mori TaxID=7091 RepID=A0A8R2M8R9_BOMMO|nr:uncharacterized protein LOC101742374 [Bombyx mori]
MRDIPRMDYIYLVGLKGQGYAIPRRFFPQDDRRRRGNFSDGRGPGARRQGCGESGVMTVFGREAFAALGCLGAVGGSTARARFLPRATVVNPSEVPGWGLAADSYSISDSESEPELTATEDAIDAGAGVGGDIGESRSTGAGGDSGESRIAGASRPAL